MLIGYNRLYAKMMHLLRNIRIYPIFLSFFLFSCQNPANRDWEKIDYNVKIMRFDKALDSLTPENALAKHQEWKKTYGTFYADFIEKILPMGAVAEDEQVSAQLIEVSQNQNFNDLKKDVIERFPTLEKSEQELAVAMKRLQNKLPEIALPERWVAYLSGFVVQTVVGEDYMGVGLDMFLGSDARFYPALVPDIPLYISRRFTPENLVPRLVEAFVREEIVSEEPLESDFLSHMLYHGKAMYLMDIALPSVEDSLKIGYTSAQLKWADRYESSIWDWVVQENKLFDTDYLAFQKHLNEAPFTPELGQGNESAPKLGVFLGWKIVRKFMKENPGTSPEELLLLDDAQQILKLSKYKGN